MKRSTNGHLTEGRVRIIVREEIDIAFETKLDQKLEQKLEQKLDQKFKERIDPLMIKIDKLIAEIRKNNENYDLQSGLISSHTDEIEELDTRVTHLEKKARNL